MSELEDKISKDVSNNTMGGVLARLFRKTLFELGFNPIRFSKQLDNYISHTNKLASTSKYIRRETRSHVLRKLTNEELTWKVFMTGMFQFLNVKRMKVTIKLTHVNGKETEHSVSIINSEVRNEE